MEVGNMLFEAGKLFERRYGNGGESVIEKGSEEMEPLKHYCMKITKEEILERKHKYWKDIFNTLSKLSELNMFVENAPLRDAIQKSILGVEDNVRAFNHWHGKEHGPVLFRCPACMREDWHDENGEPPWEDTYAKEGV